MRCVTRSGKPTSTFWAVSAAICLCCFITVPSLRIDFAKFPYSLEKLSWFIGSMFRPQDPAYWPKLVGLLLESIGIAFVSIVIAITISVPTAFLAARNSTIHPIVALVIKTAAAVTRAVPDLLLALLLASALGLGPVPAIAALTISSIGFLIKAYAETIEVGDTKPVEGIRSTGADWLAIRTIAMFPSALRDFVGLSLYQFDVLVRSSAILGAVGAGGIGYDLSQAIKLQQFERLTSILFGIYLSVSLIDGFSSWARSKLT